MQTIRKLLYEARYLAEYIQPVPTWQGDQVGGSGTYSVNPQQGDAEFFWPDPSFPFHTKAANEVYKLARSLLAEYPTEGPASLIRLSIDTLGYSIQDFSPEDLKLLQMAVDWMQTGPPQPLAKGSGKRPGTSWDQIGMVETVPSQGFSQVFHGGAALPNADSGRITTGGSALSRFVLPPKQEPEQGFDRTRGLERWERLISRIRSLVRTSQPKVPERST